MVKAKFLSLNSMVELHREEELKVVTKGIELLRCIVEDSRRIMEMDSRFGTGPVDRPSVLMEGVRRRHKHHNKQDNDKEEKKVVCNFTFTITTTIRCYLWPDMCNALR